MSCTQEYIDAMHTSLAELSRSETTSTTSRLSALVEETLSLQQTLAAFNPSNYLKFQVANLAGDETSKPTDEYWLRVLVNVLINYFDRSKLA